MWEFDWGSVEAELDLDTPPLPTSGFLVAPTFWEEHCTECAVPECFSTCELYNPRRDGGCHRFTGGLRRVPGVGGIFGDGARVRFERWGKLQTLLPEAVCSKMTYRIVRLLDRMARGVDRRLGQGWTSSRLSKAWKWRRAELLATFGSRPVDWSRCHLSTAIKNPGERIGLSVELVDNQIGIARARLSIPAGTSYHRLSARELGLEKPSTGDHLRITPDGDISCDLEFLHLELLQDQSDETPEPADFVKCVVWDLDDTLWNGTLLHSNPEDLTLHDGVEELLEALDNRGILHAIASKNSAEDVFPLLERLGVSKYFVASAISWDRKSVGLTHIAKSLNIATDSLLLIDDSEFERAEAGAQHPQIRSAHPDDLDKLILEPFLNPPTTAESPLRRTRYLQEVNRRTESESFTGDHLEFLNSCEISLQLETVLSETQEERMVELLARSNQLNLSGRRYDRAMFVESRSSRSVWVCGTCKDRFGDNGIVLAARILIEESTLEVADLAISCRVAEKAVENAFFEWLRTEALDTGKQRIAAQYVSSAKNGPLERSLTRCGFQRDAGATTMWMERLEPIPNSAIVQVTSQPRLGRKPSLSHHPPETRSNNSL